MARNTYSLFEISALKGNVLFSAISTATVTNTAGEATLVSTIIGSTSIPANFLTVGRSLRITASGYYSTAAVPGTLRVRMYLSNSAVLDTTASTAPSSSTNLFFEANGVFTCRSTGATGTSFSQGNVVFSTGLTGAQVWEMTTNGVIGINTTTAMNLDVRVLWGTADASNSISGTNVVAEVLN